MTRKMQVYAGAIRGAVLAEEMPAKPPEVADLLGKMERLLQQGQPIQALEVAARSGIKSPWVTNALGVCQLRLGNAQLAVDLFRRLVLAPGGLVLRPDVPDVFKVNYAAALLAADNLAGCLQVADEIEDEENASLRRIRAAIRRWKDSLTLWQRIIWYAGGQPPRPLVLDFSPGDLG